MVIRKKLLLATAVVTLVVIMVIMGYCFTIGPDEETPSTIVSFRNGDQEVLNITCEVASTPEERELGLMHREALAPDSGMLFVFDTPTEASFYMKNTLIPLDMIFIDEYGIVSNVEEADVQAGVPDSQLTHYLSEGPVKWVVEINQGLSASYEIGAGTQVYIYESD